MNLRDRLRDRSTVMRMGMVFLILASCARYFLHADGLTGLLCGLAIGTLLLSIRMSRSNCAGRQA